MSKAGDLRGRWNHFDMHHVVDVSIDSVWTSRGGQQTFLFNSTDCPVPDPLSGGKDGHEGEAHAHSMSSTRG